MSMRPTRSLVFPRTLRSVHGALGVFLGGLGWAASLFVGGAFLESRSAQASIVMALELPDLVQQADQIALVDVLSQHADWDSKHERILSTVELKVVERWKGDRAAGDAASDRITVVQPGGTVGDLTMTVTGLSTFTAGERALVFLRGNVSAAHVVGMGQGKRRVRFEAATNRWLVHAPDLRNATLVKPRVATPAAGPAAGSLQRVTPPAGETALDDLRVQVKALMGTTAR